MDIQATKIELAKQLLNVEKASVLDKIRAVLLSDSEDVVAYTALGDALTEEQYINHIKSVSESVEEGAASYTSSEVRDYVLNREAR